jgi:phenylalanyl-tRNA synthetase alpha chain
MALPPVKKIIATLHPLERKVLPLLDKYSSLTDIASVSGLKEVAAMRAMQWLANKKLVVLSAEPKEIVELDKNGKFYLAKGLPERVFLVALKDKELAVSKLADKTGLSKEEVNVCIGGLRARGAIILLKDKELKVKITEQGLKALDREFLEEKFLKKKFPVAVASLTDEERYAYESLKRRKSIIKSMTVKQKFAKLTELGNTIVATGIKEEGVIDRLTPQVIRSGEWKDKKLRMYDVVTNVPKIYAARKQHYRKFLDWVRQKFMSLGFTEMTGPIVESEFWNMDALFMPQFHSARDIHDVYCVKEPVYGDVDESLLKKVKASHENGFGTGSKGWNYSFDVKKTRRLLLRSQGTACSARTLASKDLKIPGKYFGITRCFRKDVIDATHNVDFYQTEGIIVEEGLNIRHLFGLLKMFAKEFANAQEIKIVPGYFPFTEPSCELFAKHPELGWVELGGAGILRPEVVKPLLGKEVSVLAWGIGIDRIAMFKLGIKDIRQLFSHDLEFLKNARTV